MADFDLVAVLPWAFSSVVSGTPFLFEPYIVGARFAAEYRNWHWQHDMESRQAGTVRGVTVSPATQHYPAKTDAIADRGVPDPGRNFGRFARTGLMSDFIQSIEAKPLSGIPVNAWRRFLRVFTENPTPQSIDSFITTITRERRNDPALRNFTAQQLADLRQLFDELQRFFGTV